MVRETRMCPQDLWGIKGKNWVDVKTRNIRRLVLVVSHCLLHPVHCSQLTHSESKNSITKKKKKKLNCPITFKLKLEKVLCDRRKKKAYPSNPKATVRNLIFSWVIHLCIHKTKYFSRFLGDHGIKKRFHKVTKKKWNETLFCINSVLGYFPKDRTGRELALKIWKAVKSFKLI